MSITEKARTTALAYVECINSKDLERLLSLFAEDAHLVHPFGLFESKPKLAEFYGGLVMLADTQLTVARVAAENNVCCAEVIGISPQAPEKAQYAIDLFELNDDGLIRELAIYYRNFDLK